MVSRIVIRTNRSKYVRYRKVQESVSYRKDDVEIKEYSGAAMFEDVSEPEELVLLCIESNWDMVRYFLHRRKMERDRVILINGRVLLGNVCAKILSDKMIHCQRGGTARVVEQILDAVICKGTIELNISDLILACSNGSVEYLGYGAAFIELVLYRLLRSINENQKCCLLYLTGGVTICDISEFCELLPMVEDAASGYRFDEQAEEGTVRVFSLWRNKKER